MDSDSDLGDDIVSGELPKHLPAPGALRVDFKPWHRVRKQFIRERQWNHEIHHLAQRLRRELQVERTEWGASDEAAPPEDLQVMRPLRCLLLPGDELLDVRCLWHKLQAEGRYLKFLGFNTAITTDDQRRRAAVMESAVTQLARVCKDSHVTSDAFQSIARENTQAYRLFRQYGPYDVVNLDLCDSLVPRGKLGETEANISALHQLLLYQIQHQRTSWLLFATTQVDRSTVDQPEINQLAKPLRKNCEQHALFAEAMEKLIPGAAFRSATHTLDISYLNADHLVKAFGVILGKWLVNILASASPRCAVKLLSSYRYVIRDDKDVEMLSLGFLITPHYTPPQDQTGLSTLQPKARDFPSELDTALGMISVAEKIRNVDQILAADAGCCEQLAKSKAKLLGAAGYDPEAYLRWVADGERDTG